MGMPKLSANSTRRPCCCAKIRNWRDVLSPEIGGMGVAEAVGDGVIVGVEVGVPVTEGVSVGEGGRPDGGSRTAIPAPAQHPTESMKLVASVSVFTTAI